jgi:hypothetical protein
MIQKLEIHAINKGELFEFVYYCMYFLAILLLFQTEKLLVTNVFECHTLSVLPSVNKKYLSLFSSNKNAVVGLD